MTNIHEKIIHTKKDAQEFNGGKIVSIHVDELSTQPSQE